LAAEYRNHHQAINNTVRRNAIIEHRLDKVWRMEWGEAVRIH
jgi:hypothetical protein